MTQFLLHFFTFAHAPSPSAASRINGDEALEISLMSIGLQLRDYRLTTAEILYHLPDHPGLLQTYVWQELDLAPRFPVLKKFLAFWTRELDGKLHSIRVANAPCIHPGNLRHTPHLLTLH